MLNRIIEGIVCVLGVAVLSSCARLKPGTHAPRKGDEIVAAGQFFHTGTPVVLWPVVLWLDPGGYDAYRVERRFAPFGKSDWKSSQEENPDLTSPNRYGLRRAGLSDLQIEEMRGGGMDLPTLQGMVDQFVIHFDACGTSRQCFKVLHDQRCLSVHFMLDLDGTIYQTLDLKERAWHASSANSRSIGIEIANIGAYDPKRNGPLKRWYQKDSQGRTVIRIPEQLQPAGIRTENFIPQPTRPDPIQGTIQGEDLEQYDFTPEQYEALTKLTAALCRVFPKLTCDYPKTSDGKVVPNKIPAELLEEYHGLLGHFHVQTNKVDPGPAFQWDKVTKDARKLLRE
jgi:N-acetylmuramoyl-L-alanine amidase